MKQLQNLSNTNKTYLALAVFAVLIAVFYGNTLFNGFVFDDLAQIEQNPQAHSLKYLPQTIIGCHVQSVAQGCKGQTIYYRPPLYLSMLLTWQIAPKPWPFHLMNLLYFWAIVFLIFYLAKILTGDFRAALISALIFLIHPINSEVVNWASAAVELTLTLFVLSAVIFYVQYRQSPSLKRLILVYAFYFLGLLAKEPAVFIPVIALLLDALFFKIPLRQLLRAEHLKRYLFFGVPFVLYLILRISVIGFSTGGGFTQLTFPERIHAAITLFATYIWKLLYPFPLSAFHGFEKSADFLSLTFLGSLLIALAFFALLFFFLKKQKNLAIFSFLWFFLFLSPVLLFLGSIGEHVFAERYLFLPTIGFVFLMGSAISSFLKTYALSFLRTPHRFVFLILAGFLILASWVAVYHRNKDWKDQETISLKTLSLNPNAHNIRRELAYEYLNQGDHEKAKAEFEYLVEKAPNWKDITMAYKGLGDYYRVQSDTDKALEYYLKATETGRSARDFVPYNDVGVIYMERENYLKGFAYFCQSLGLFSGSQAVRDNFNDALNVINEKYIQQGILHKKILEEFDKSPDEKIVYRDKRCEKGSCQYAFSFQAQQFEVLPPFLITAATASGKELEIINKGFNPETGVIVLELDSKHKDQTLTFLFPTCQGIYYEAVAKPQ